MAVMVNSRSRLHHPDGSGARIADYIGTNWNGRHNGCSPLMFYGVEPTGEVDRNGLNVYALSDEQRRLRSVRRRPDVHPPS